MKGETCPRCGIGRCREDPDVCDRCGRAVRKIAAEVVRRSMTPCLYWVRRSAEVGYAEANREWHAFIDAACAHYGVT